MNGPFVGFPSGKAKDSLVAMGPAVFHGGFSTFLAFALTYISDSYFFIAFATVSTGNSDRIHA